MNHESRCPSISIWASISTLSPSCSLNTPSLTDIEAGRIWLSPATNLRSHVHVTWPSDISAQQIILLNQCLVTAIRHAALWSQLNLQPSLTVKPTQCPNTCLLLVSLTAVPPSVTPKKAPTHRLSRHVPFSHLKPPEGLPHWTLDEVHLEIHISSSLPCSTPNDDSMLFESSTLLERQAGPSSPSPAELANVEHSIDLIDAALRLALTNSSSKTLSGVKITEKSSFKHLDSICPAMWGLGHLEALASRAVFLPTISHAMSNSISQRAHSMTLKEKLKEIARQECVAASSSQHTAPKSIQQAVSIRLWRLMQRRLRDPSAGKKLKSVRVADTALSLSESGQDNDDILNFEEEDERHDYSQSEGLEELYDEEDEDDLLDVECESECEDLFTDVERDKSPVDDDMLDYLYDGQHDGHDQITAAFHEDEMSSVFEEMLEL
ncbi:hypothetical protein KCU87_g66, partial [Aureobasidium melanogenum]